MIRYKQNVVKHDSVEEVICPDGTAFLQFVADNTDHDICTIDGKNTHHGLGSIAIANGNFTMQQVGRNRIPREKKDKWSEVQGNVGINIVQYFAPNVPALARTSLRPIVRVKPFLLCSFSKGPSCLFF